MKANRTETAAKLAYFYPKCRYRDHKTKFLSAGNCDTFSFPPERFRFFLHTATEQTYPISRSDRKLQGTEIKQSIY